MNRGMHDLAAGYALDALDDRDRARFERHLETCEACATEVVEMAETAAGLARTLAEPPPETMRDRVLAAIESIPQDGVIPRAAGGSSVTWAGRRLSLVWSAVAVAAVAAVAVLSWAMLRSTEPMDAVLAAPDAVHTAAVATDAGSGRFATAAVVHSTSMGEAVLVVEGLAPVADDRTYELWVIDGSSVSPAGLFVPNDRGVVRTMIDGDVGPGMTIAVTEEPSGGADAPTGDVLFAAEIDA